MSADFHVIPIGDLRKHVEDRQCWRDFLADEEVAELSEIEAAKVAGQQRARRIYDRCRKRMKKASNNA